MFRLNKGLAEGEDRGLMEDREENAQQTQRKRVLENKVEAEFLQNRSQLRDSSPMKLIRKLREQGEVIASKLKLQMLLSFL